MHTRDQQRARYAHECIDDVLATATRADYRAMANEFGANVMRCGLCAALAFIEREQTRTTAAAQFLDHLARHLSDAGRKLLPRDVSGANLHAAVRTVGLDDYMVLTREALRLALWLRRAAQARIPARGRDAKAHHA